MAKDGEPTAYGIEQAQGRVDVWQVQREGLRSGFNEICSYGRNNDKPKDWTEKVPLQVKQEHWYCFVQELCLQERGPSVQQQLRLQW